MRRRSLGVLAIALIGQWGISGSAADAVIAAPARITSQTAAPEAVAGITLVGRGNGHGIGLSQWGAYGYAVDSGWDAWAIVDHYFGGTVHGTSPLDAVVTVRLQGLDGAQTAVVADTADLAATAPNAVVLAVPPGTRAMVARYVGGGYSVWASASAACPLASDPLAGWTAVATGLPAVTFSTAAPATTTALGQLVSTCRPDGTLRTYRGTIQAITGSAAEIRTVNAVPVEQYVRAVVAKEMSPSWANAGGGRGMAALQAQVIAGRSYALSEHLYTYAMTCDSVCQTYQGAATRASLSAPYTSVEHPLSDPAVTSTAGMVLRDAKGVYTHAMYAASSGGYTALNATLGFPSVPDDGDATANNPYHTWTTTLTAAAIQAAYPSIGTFTGITIRQRNGLGDLGGRVLMMTVDGMTIGGATMSVQISGDQFRSAMGLKSNWFAVEGAPQAGVDTIATAATALKPAKRLAKG